MINIVMLVKDRYKLTRQSLESLAASTIDKWTLVIVNDGSSRETYDYINTFGDPARVRVVRYWERASNGLLNLGAAKNHGVSMSNLHFKRGEFLYLSDNDVFFTLGWDKILCGALRLREPDGFRLLGGQNHPFHKPIDHSTDRWGSVIEYGAVAGTSWLLKWDTWFDMGKLVETGAGGVGQSEDQEYCERIRKRGGKVGAIHPSVVIDTGITQTDGALSVGHDAKMRVPGVVYG